MSNKIKTVYTCGKCGAQAPKWSGRCLECGSWGTLSEETVSGEDLKKAQDSKVPAASLVDLSKTENSHLSRHKTGIGELDRVLGGGLVAGSLILLGGEPGIGKSTIVAQIADRLSGGKDRIVYVSGEESAGQVKGRLERLGCDLSKIGFISETNTEKICSAIRQERPLLAVIDSIQTVSTADVESEAGSLAQIRASAAKFLEVAKKDGVAVLMIGHITKDGQIAGPKSLEHIVDVVVYLEADTGGDYRVLRAAKNRFGSVNELGVFEMTGEGLKEVKNPSLIFLDKSAENISGSVISSIMEGTRPFLVNIQALVTKTVFGYPQRRASGFDLNRLQVLSAVLTKKTKFNLTNQDVIVNVVGGLRANDPALDLAVCQAIITSILNQASDRKTLVLGEVGLGGEIRNVAKLEARLKEAVSLGFEKAIIPNADVKVDGLELKKIKNVAQLLEI
jgi:DNA repair protein RadA/Sms